MLRDKLCPWTEKNKRRQVVAVLLIACSVLVLTLSPAFREVAGVMRDDLLLMRLLETSGAGRPSISVTAWVRVDQGAPGAGDPEILAGNVAAQLPLAQPWRQPETWQNTYARGSKWEGELTGGGSVTVLAQTLRPAEGEKLSHVMVSASGVEKRRVRFLKETLRASLRVCGGESYVGVTYAGTIDKELEDGELQANAYKMMALAGAPVQEKTVNDNLVSLAGFSPRLSRDARYAGKKVNVNVALRRNPVEQVTYVYVATPFILTEY